MVQKSSGKTLKFRLGHPVCSAGASLLIGVSVDHGGRRTASPGPKKTDKHRRIRRAVTCKSPCSRQSQHKLPRRRPHNSSSPRNICNGHRRTDRRHRSWTHPNTSVLFPFSCSSCRLCIYLAPRVTGPLPLLGASARLSLGTRDTA